MSNQNQSLDKKALNARQIIKYANSKKLIDAVSEVDTIYNGNGKKSGQYNKKVVLTVNEFGIQGHKEKYAAFYWDINDALIICDDIVNNRFETETYGKTVGTYSCYGGGQSVSRILQIGVKNGAYIIQVSLYGAKQGPNGSILPDQNNKIDSHNIQLNRFDARKFFKAIQAHIESKMSVLTTLPQATQTAPTNSYTPKTDNPAPKQQEKPKSNTDFLSDPFADGSDPFGG